MADCDRFTERQLDLIYKAIAQRNYKQGLKLCDAKKASKNLLVMALKGHLLERLGRRNEAIALCKTVQSDENHCKSEELLNVLSLVFRYCGCREEIIASYEAAVKLHPNNDCLLEQLFFAYVRQFEYLKQQTTAMLLYKKFSKTKYIYWVGLSMLLQVKAGVAPAKLLLLASKMVIKVAETCQEKGSERVQLIIDILLEAKEYEQALQVYDQYILPLRDDVQKNKPRALEGTGTPEDEVELGAMQLIDQYALEAKLTTITRNWTRANEVYRKLLSECGCGDWNHLMGYFQTIVELYNVCQDISLFEQGLAYLQGLQEQEDNKMQRGLYLAELELYRIQYKTCVTEDIPMQVVKLLIAYVERFGSKTCCLADILPIVDSFSKVLDAAPAQLPKSCFTEFTSWLWKHYDEHAITPSSDESQVKNSQMSLKRRILCVQLQYHVGHYKHMEESALCEAATKLSTEYRNTLWLNVSAAGGQREVQQGDDLVLLVVQMLLDLYNRSNGQSTSVASKMNLGNKVYLLQAAALLEFALKQSPYNYFFKVSLIFVYGALGCIDQAIYLFKSLDIKQIMLDSLSYLILDEMIAFGRLEEVQSLCSKIKELHASSGVDAPEGMVKAYSLGVYSKALEITEFQQKRMKNSHQLAIANNEIQIAQLFSSGESTNKLMEFLMEGDFANIKALSDPSCLSSNQDRSMRASWLHLASPNVMASNYRCDIDFGDDTSPLVYIDRSLDRESSFRWIQIRENVLKLMSCAFSGAKNDFNSCAALVKRMLSNERLLTTAENTNLKLFNIQWDAFVNAIDMTEAVLQYTQGESTNYQPVTVAFEKLQENLLLLDDAFSTILIVSDVESLGLLSTYIVQATMLFLTQTGHWIMIMIAACAKSMPSKRKKKVSQEYMSLVASLRLVGQAYSKFLENLGNRLSVIDNLPIDVEWNLDSNMSVVPFLRDDDAGPSLAKVQKHVAECTKSTIASFFDTIAKKKAFMKTIKL